MTTPIRRNISLIAGPLTFLLFIVIFDLDPSNRHVTYTAGVAIWMAIWWITEVIPLGITALLPVVLFPLLGIMKGKIVAPIYFNHIIFLFIGGFMVALAMQRWNLHKRISLRILLLIGVRPRRILLGFMCATAFLSMWISNTAATMMMVPIVLAVVLKLEENLGEDAIKRYAIGLFLGVAYGATLGGISTLVGTPPNLSFVRIFSISFPDAPEISFASWVIFAFPISIGFLILVWLLLSITFRIPQKRFKVDSEIFSQQYKELGPMSYEEKIVLIDFIFLALLWLFRKDISIGTVTIPGWSNIFPEPSYIDDGTVAIFMAMLLFIIPAKQPGKRRIMNWKVAADLPWNIVILFGGGFALAQGFRDSGLSMWLGTHLSGLSAFHPLAIVAAICLTITFLTELTSNTATTEMLLPILAALAVAIDINPLFLMIPGTLSCSLAFMLPVATPPNAIIFGTGRLKIIHMAKIGLILNLIGVLLITSAIYFLGQVVFGIDLSVLPTWVK